MREAYLGVIALGWLVGVLSSTTDEVNKYKLKQRKTRLFAKLWLRQVSKDYAYLFPHWRHGFTP